MPALLADLIMEKIPSVPMAAIALEICKKLKTNPVPFIIAIAVSSNLQGAATLVGDTTAIMLGSYADMSFWEFIIYDGKPGIFFAVERGAVVSALILAWLFRSEKQCVSKGASRTAVTDYVPSVLLIGMIVLLICASFIQNKPDITKRWTADNMDDIQQNKNRQHGFIYAPDQGDRF